MMEEAAGESGARRDFRSAPADNAHFTPARSYEFFAVGENGNV